jgi:hypothetical protein
LTRKFSGERIADTHTFVNYRLVATCEKCLNRKEIGRRGLPLLHFQNMLNTFNPSTFVECQRCGAHTPHSLKYLEADVRKEGE